MRLTTLGRIGRLLLTTLIVLELGSFAGAAEPAAPKWRYSADLLRPFWEGQVMEGESVLFVRDAATGEAKASVLFPIEKVLAVRNATGDRTYVEGKDYKWSAGSREIVLPAGSTIVSKLPSDLRRPPKSQPYELTHRDGNGEILFGGKLEYAEMQTIVTYRHAAGLWKSPVPKFDPQALPRTTSLLRERRPLKIVLLGDSISTGANASGVYDAAPFQPAYPELLRLRLEERYGAKVELTNLSVGGTDTAWGLTQLDKVVDAKPDLVLLAFGMNDSAGRPPADFQKNTRQMTATLRERLPEVEFILIATMLGNRDWVRLKHEYFPGYRDALRELTGPGTALADLTSIWTGFLELKRDWDLTGNGVNHPNDFGHRVYAQAIAALLVAP